MFVIIIYLLMLFTPTVCMNFGVLVTTSDSKEFTLPQWKIESSRLMHRKQELQKVKERYYGVQPASLVLKKICSEKLVLFSGALDAHDFLQYFNGLTPDKQHLLKCVAGEQELDSSVITAELVNICLSQDIIEKNIDPHLEISHVEHYLRRLLILDNCKNQRFTQTTKDFGKKCTVRHPNGGYDIVPALVIERSGIGNYDGNTGYIDSTIFGVKWIVEMIKIANEKLYFITSTYCAHDKQELKIENQKNLWLMTSKEEGVVKKVIKHTDEISHTAFSNDGNYLVTSSKGLNSQLILTVLEEQNKVSAYSDIFLTGHLGEIGAVCFNNQSTVLAVGSENGIQLWDTHTHEQCIQLDCPGGKVRSICFNDDDSRLAIVTRNVNGVFGCTVTLWDTTDFTAIHQIKDFSVKCLDIEDVRFDTLTDTLIVKAYRNIFVVHGRSGEIIMKTSKSNRINIQAAVFIPYTNILATAICTHQNYGNTLLWDISSRQLISTVLKEQTGLSGVGITPDGRCIISTLDDSPLIKTELFDSNAADCLDWIVNKSNVLQKYLLLRLHRAQQAGEVAVLHPDCPELRIVQSLLIEPCNVKELVEKYLLKQ